MFCGHDLKETMQIACIGQQLEPTDPYATLMTDYQISAFTTRPTIPTSSY